MVDLIRKRFAPVLLAAGLMLGVRAVAYAHATLVSAEPAAGSHLTSSPTRVRLVFNEQLEVPLAKVSLTGGDGRTLKLAVAGDPHDVHALIAPISGLAAGKYRLDWHIVSDDGHPVDGAYFFSIGDDSALAPPPADSASRTAFAFEGAPVVPSLLRGLAVGCLMAFAGVLWFMATAADDAASRRRQSLARWLAALTIALLAANLAAWATNAASDHALTGENLSSAFSTNAGRVLLLQGALAVLATWALLLARRVRLATAFAAAAVIVSGAIGHPAAIQPEWSIPAKAIHLIASAAWIGGLLWLATAERGNAAGFARDAARASSTAFIAVMLVALSGIVQTFLFLPSVFGLFLSPYGLVVVAKVTGLLVLIAFGAYHRFRLMPGLAGESASPPRLVSSVRRELTVMAIVVLLGGLLAYIPPPMSGMPDMPSTSTH